MRRWGLSGDRATQAMLRPMSDLKNLRELTRQVRNGGMVALCEALTSRRLRPEWQ